MNPFSTLGAVALLALGGAATSGCLKAPDFPVEPTITFNSLRKIYAPPAVAGATPADTLVFALDFQDGDGDLGLDADDAKVPPYNAQIGGHNNLATSNNYFIQPFKKVRGSFVPFYTPGGYPGEYDSRYPRLETTTDTKAAPLKGTLRYKLRLPLNRISYSTGDVFRFAISIMDRKMHESNTVTTTEVTLGP